MAYTINKADGTTLTVLDDATVDNTTSLTLVGRNYVGYGEIQNENFVFLLENFSNDNPPATPLEGQVWFDKQNNVLNVYDGDKWVEVGAAAIETSAPQNPPVGAFWLKQPENVLHVYNGTQWTAVGPEYAPGYDLTRAQSTTLVSDAGTTFPVIKMMVNDICIAILSSNPFNIASSNAVPGFSSLDVGMTLNSATVVSGRLKGVADKAAIFETERKINNVGFNGSADITIKSSTTNLLKSGAFITGNDFDGGTEETWAVDATSSNVIGKVVARDASGNFSANNITADLTGDVAGNVNASSGTSNFDIIQANRVIGPVLSGNANSATQLNTPRNINGVAFDGTADITVPADAFTLTNNALANNVKSSSLTSVGTLTNLNVAGDVSIGATSIVLKPNNKEIVSDRELTIKTVDGSSTFGLNFISSNDAINDGVGPNAGIKPVTDGDTDLGKNNSKFDNVHANTFIGNLQGNADTATLAVSGDNLSGGAPGSVPYQTASGVTAFANIGTAGQVLKVVAGVPVFEDITFANLNLGAYISGLPYNGIVNSTIAVDADTANTANKVVARDASGNFAAGTISADLVGNASTATALETARTINGVSFDGTANITITATDPNAVPKAGGTMTGFLTLHSAPTANLHAATKKYVDDAVSGITILWAGATTLSNVQATYRNYPAGTKVAFWEERNYSRPANSNGGSVSISDRYRRVVQKQPNGSWANVG